MLAKRATVLLSSSVGTAVIRDMSRAKQDHLISLTSEIIEEDTEI